MTWLEYLYAWLLLGLVNYGIKLLKYHNDWQKDGNQVFFVACTGCSTGFRSSGVVDHSDTLTGESI